MVKVRIGNSFNVIGEFVLIHEDGTEEITKGKRSFCRCGLSASMPYCDQTHKKYKIVMTENNPKPTASWWNNNIDQPLMLSENLSYSITEKSKNEY